MVRRGRAKLYCKECGIGCGAELSIQHNNSQRLNLKNEAENWVNYEKVIDNECPHFNFSVSVYANNNWSPWGDPDEIKFCLESKCKMCTQVLSSREECQGFDQKPIYVIPKECCGNKIDCEYCFTANTFLDHVASQSAFWAGPLGTNIILKFITQFYYYYFDYSLGWTVAGIVTAVTENLTTFKISSTRK